MQGRKAVRPITAVTVDAVEFSNVGPGATGSVSGVSIRKPQEEEEEEVALLRTVDEFLATAPAMNA